MRKIEMLTRQELEIRLHVCLQRRFLPDSFLYVGEAGARNWMALEKSESFPIASRLTDLLQESAPAIAMHLDSTTDLVSVGVGDGRKERILLEALLQYGMPHYCAVDVSSAMVDIALENVADLSIEKVGIVAFCEDLARIRRYWRPPALLCLLGNNFSNYDPQTLLEIFSGQMEEGGCFLFDCHVVPESKTADDEWRRQTESSYRSETNVQFNISPLVSHGLNPDHCLFELDLLPVQTPYGAVLKTRKQVRILSDCALRFEDGEVSLSAGETIRMGFTYKYTTRFVEQILSSRRVRVVERFASETAENIIILARLANGG